MKSANKNQFPMNFQKPRNFFMKSANFFLFFVLKCTKREHVHNLNRRWARSITKRGKSNNFQRIKEDLSDRITRKLYRVFGKI